MRLSSVDLCELPNAPLSVIRSYHKHYIVYENNRVQ